MEYLLVNKLKRYKLEFRYTSIYSAKVINELEVEIAASAQEAVDTVRRGYAAMQNLCIDHVYIDAGSTWDAVDNWD